MMKIVVSCSRVIMILTYLPDKDPYSLPSTQLKCFITTNQKKKSEMKHILLRSVTYTKLTSFFSPKSHKNQNVSPSVKPLNLLLSVGNLPESNYTRDLWLLVEFCFTLDSILILLFRSFHTCVPNWFEMFVLSVCPGLLYWSSFIALRSQQHVRLVSLQSSGFFSVTTEDSRSGLPGSAPLRRYQ